MPKKVAAEGRSPADESRSDLSTSGPRKKGEGGRARKGAETASGSRTERRGIAGVPGSKNPERRCQATVYSTGLQCKRAAIKGGTVCTTHGGKAPQVQKSAKERLLELADPAIAALSKIVRDEDTDDAVRLRAALGVLDRIGYGPGAKLEIGKTQWDQTLEDVFVKAQQDGAGGTDRSLSEPDERRALGRGDGGPDDWEDYEQAVYDAQADIDADRYAEEAAQVERDRIRSTGPVVRGEVVNNDPPDYRSGR